MGSKAFKPTLKNSEAISAFLNHPEKVLKLVHVAGSNGKGSTCSMLASILTEAGFKVGLFTSPHIKDYTERIRINGERIPQSHVIDFVDRIKAGQFEFNPSFFEITFGLALDYFKNKNCDICIIETGLGGKFDATNIIDPILSVITNISLEHTAMLGDTIEKIASEKAGIIKPKTPVVLGKMKFEAEKVMISVAQEHNSMFIKSTDYDSLTEKYKLPLLGAYQKENLSTVIATLAQLDKINFKTKNESIQKGLDNITKNTGFAGRIQVVNLEPRIIQDVSHNPDGIEATLNTVINSTIGTLHIVFGTSADKDIYSSLSLFPLASNMYFTEFSNERSAKIEDFKTLTESFDYSSKKYFSEPNKALKAAKDCASTNDTILIIGSFFLISDFL
jgi:dihydrofolate synthase / folylpolyglutamate synthase